MTALGPVQDDVDRRFDQLGTASAVDSRSSTPKSDPAPSSPPCRPESPLAAGTQRRLRPSQMVIAIPGAWVYGVASMFSRARCPRVIGGAARVALLPAAALAVHQLRYLLAYGSAAEMELQRQGHSYLHSVVPWIVLVLALVVGGFLYALGRTFSGHTSLSRFGLSFSALWLACTVALVSIYCCQEFLEGLFATGHPGGLVGIFGFGGWWAIPAAASVALVLAAVFHGARWVLEEVAQRFHQARAPRRRRAEPSPRPATVPTPRLAPLADGWSGRGPPL